MQTRRSKKPKLGPAAKHFIEAASQILEVQLIVFVDGEGDDRRIWTVIDAPPFDQNVRRKLIELEVEAYMKADEGIGYRLVNLQDFKNGLADLHLEGMPILFQRKTAAA